MPSLSNKKRKAESLYDEDGTDRPAPAVRKSKDDRHLPAPVWGHVLDYMPYEEVRSALLVGKIIANDAVKYVHALNITKACQMDGPSTRRFPNIEELNILCMYNFETNTLSKETCQRFVPLLVASPRLRRVFAGGVSSGGSREEYYVESIAGPEGHAGIFRILVDQIFTAFKMRLLPKTIETMGGICREAVDLASYGHIEGAQECKSFCQDICKYFPLEDIFASNAPGFVCIPHSQVYDIITRRPGAVGKMREYSGEYLIDHMLNEEWKYVELNSHSDLMQRLSEAGLTGRLSKYPCVQYLTKKALEQLDDFIAFGFDPSAISKEDLYERMDIENIWRGENVFTKSTVDALVSRGFAFDENDLIVLDETKEPVLSEIPSLIRGGVD